MKSELELEDLYPLSPLQKGLLFHALAEPSSDSYIEQHRLLVENLDTGALRGAFAAVVERYDVLRTAFDVEHFEAPMQAVFRRVELPWTEIDLQDCPKQEREARLARHLFDERRALNPADAPLARVLVARVSPDEHVVIWTHHHLLLDGWSIQIVLKDVMTAYESQRRGQAPRFSTAPRYRDYLSWLERFDQDHSEAWFKRALSGFREPTPIPAARQEPSLGLRVPRWGNDERSLDLETSKRAYAFCRKLGITPNILVEAGWAILLGRHAQRDDVVFGITVSGRPPELPDIEQRVGLFINTLPLRVKLADHATSRQLLEWLRAEHAELVMHEYSAPVDVQRWSGLEHGQALYSTLITFENYPIKPSEKSTLTIREASSAIDTHYPLTLLGYARDSLLLCLQYDRRLYDDADASSLLTQLARVIRSLVEAPQHAPLAIDLDDDEGRARLRSWNDTARTHVHASTSQRFETQASATPDAIALRAGAETLSYRELDRRANRLAHLLRDYGVGVESRVALCMPRVAELVVALLAVAKTGAAYVPLDPGDPIQRISFLLEDSKALWLLTHSSVADRLPVTSALTLVLDELSLPEDDSPLGVAPPAESLAYVIYTSGSTGRPKGVLVTHRGLSNYVAWATAEYRASEPGGSAVASSLSFDLTVTSLLVPLVAGSGIELFSNDTLEALDAIADGPGGYTLLKVTPAQLGILAQRVGPERAAGLTRAFVVGGEALRAEHVAFWRTHAPNTRILNEYGPTETVVGCTLHDVGADDEGGLPIGRPIANTEIHVLDASLKLVPAGAWGELFIGGAGVARGYEGRPELTAERFVPDAFSGRAGARLYRTGDRTRFRSDGVLEFAGRIDEQIKLRGYRIEPGEIESALRRHPHIQDAAVVVKNERLVAYVVAEGDNDPAKWRAFLEAELPAYMLPQSFVSLDALPLAPSGKVERRALPEPTPVRPLDAYEAPRSPTEEVIAAIWADVLNVERVSRHDDFFDLGGHSLTATQVVARIHSALGADTPVALVFEARRLDAFAMQVDEILASERQTPPLVRRPHGTEPPLSFTQERLWFLEQLEPGTAAWNIPGCVRLRGTLNVDALSRSIDEIVRRHELLRTTFAARDSGPVQVVHPFREVPIRVEDTNEADLFAEIQRLVSRPMDLVTGPLLSVTLLRLGPEDHVCVFVAHHIVFDGWSRAIFLRELAELYAAFSSGADSPLAELPIQFADFAAWQRAWLSGEELERRRAYWEKQLADGPPALRLPTDRPRPLVQTYSGDVLEVVLPDEVARGIDSVSRSEAATPFMVLSALFNVLLHRWSGQDDITIGSPIANRARPETENLIGFLLNTLVLRTNLGQNPTFRELLAHVRETALEAYTHQDVPFEELLKDPERDPSKTPLFQVMFILQTVPRTSLRLANLELEPLPIDTGSVKFDMLLSLVHRNDSTSGTLEYNTDLFERSTIERFWRDFTRLASALLGEPDLHIDDVSLLSDAERREVVVTRNATLRELPRRTLPELLVERARSTPEAPAIIANGSPITYATLVRRAAALARELRTRGVGPETIVGLVGVRSLETLISLVGILEAGAAYLPLDPGLPPERMRELLHDSCAALLVAPSSTSVPETALPVVVPPSDQGDPELAALSCENAAYVIYTSGSTGTPRGVVVPHRAVVNHAFAVSERFELRESDRILQFHSLSFDASVEEMFPTWLSGAALVLQPDRVPDSLEALAELIEREGVTVVNLPTAYWHVWAEAVGRGAARVPECVRLLVIGGEAAQASRLADWTRVVGERVRVCNTYGPTEATISATAYGPSDRRAEEAFVVPIGGPLANVKAYVLDRLLRPVPVGIIGELCLGGAGIARGYLGRPDLTSERFVPDPFQSGQRLYRTGDLVRWQAAGPLEFVGRADRQIKLRGYRIELGEIEAALRTHPKSKDAVVLVRRDGLVGYVTSDDPDIARELSELLAARLPAHMLPNELVVLREFPLSPTGKVDKKALPEPASPEEEEEGPRTPMEELIAGVWAALLGVPRVKPSDDFFELGGHSLLATQMIARIRSTLGVQLPVRALFQNSELSRFARAAERALADPKARPTVGALVRVPRTEHLPLSFAQERMWFLMRVHPGTCAYNLAVAVRARGPLSARALERAVGALIRRHEMLRVRFDADVPEQRILDEIPAPIVYEEVSSVDEARRRARELGRTPFDLVNGPSFRLHVLRLGADDHVLAVGMHHIVSDGWSVGIFLKELLHYYEAELDGSPDPLPELPVSYADYASWQRNHLSGEVLGAQLAYWQDRLSGFTPLELPTDHPRPSVYTFEGASVLRRISPERSRALRALALAEGVTPFMVLVLAYQVLLGAYARQDDITIGTPVGSRPLAETEGVIGLFVNALCLRTNLAGDPSVKDLLARVREAALGAYAHQDAPFEKVVEAVQPVRDPSKNAVASAWIVLQNATPNLGRARRLDITGFGFDVATVRFDLSLQVFDSPKGYELSFDYNVALFQHKTIEALGRDFEAILDAFVDAPHEKLSELGWQRNTERGASIVRSERTEQKQPATHAVVAQAALANPAGTAVVAEEGSLSHAELWQRANALAEQLGRLGIGPDTRVGVHLSRSLHLPVALLGIWQAGAAYVPLDPASPAERLAHIIEDASLSVVVSEERWEADLPAGPHVMCIDALDLTRGGTRAARALPSPDAAAYVLYTSGSTGQPKGVVISHGALANHMAWFLREHPLRASDRVLQKTPIVFDASVWEFWAPLMSGACLVLAKDDGHRDPGYLCQAIREHGISVLQVVPSLLAALLEEPAFVECTSLSRVFAGGEALPLDVVTRFQKMCRASLVNLYGPTETTIEATAWNVPAKPSSISLGTPIDGTRLYVVDARLQPVPTGMPGELCISGAGLAQGYLSRADLTAERFVPEVDAPTPGSRMYRTGDLVRLRDDGELEYLGRIDQQIKLRGYRIELEEIEAVLRTHGAVGEAAVAVQGERLVAFVTGEPDELNVAELESLCKRKLPSYMVPAAFALRDALPRTASGKLDRSTLAHDSVAVSDAASYVPPRTPLEQTIAGTWAEVLQIERVGRDDNFFDLGGHSLLATQLVSRLRRDLGVEVPLASIFESQTCRSFAERVESLLHAGGTTKPALVQCERPGEIPLSFAQERLWFLEQLDPGKPTYNVPLVARVRGALDEERLVVAYGALQMRHEVLRTRLVADRGRARQLVSEEPLSRLRVVDIGARNLTEVIRSECLEPFELGRDAPLRALLVRESDEEWVLALTLHHVVSDAWSQGVLIRDLIELYDGLSERALPQLVVQYADYAIWQRAWLSGEELARQVAHFRDKLAGTPPLELPADRPRPALPSFRGGSASLVIERELADRLARFCREENATPFMTFLAAVQALLHRHSGQDEFAVGFPIAGRSELELEPLIGCFVNTLAVKAQLSAKSSFRDLVRRAKTETLEAYAHQHVPFEQVVDALGVPRDAAVSPVFQVMLVVQNAPVERVNRDDFVLEPFPQPNEVSKFDLTFSLGESERGWSGVIEFASDLFERASIERMSEQFALLLERALDAPDQPVGWLSLTGAKAAPRPKKAPPSSTLHSAFESMAQKMPGAIAIEDENASITYAELEGRANRIARRLARAGAQPERLIGLLLPRGISAIAAILGVLKTGAAYLPLDGSAELRLAAQLRESNPTLIVTTRKQRELCGDHASMLIDDPELEFESSEPLGISISPDALAYVIYTSGSTGMPKGTLLAHRGASAIIDELAERFRVGPGSRVLQNVPLGFDVSVSEIFMALRHGATSCIPPVETLLAGPELTDLLARRRITTLSIVASALAATPHADLPLLETLVVGGEPCPVDVMRKWAKGRRVFNAYGPTETSITATLAEVEASSWENPRKLGESLEVVEVLVLDAIGQPLPIGMRGELCIGGVGLGRGYLSRPELTAERFVPHPDPRTPGERLYRTGDRARLLEDGSIEFHGRIDGQIKLRGFRIELGEIEAALARQPGIEAAVADVRSIAEQRLLVAWFTTEPDTEIDPAKLKAKLAMRLPAYMVPAILTRVDDLPRTRTGKLDRKSLPTPVPESSGKTLPLADEIERKLAEIWSRLLGVQNVGPTDGFFELGGDSILSIQVVSRAREAGLVFSVRDVFQHPTLRALAKVARVTGTLHAEQGKLTGEVPLSPIQRWFFQQELVGEHHFNQSLLFEVRAALEIGMLRRAVAALLEHHDALGMRFHRNGDRIVQSYGVTSADDVVVPIDLSRVPVPEQTQHIEAKASELQSSLDLEAGRLIRVAYFDLGSDSSNRLLIIVHHLVSDGVSWRILLEDLERAYTRLATERSIELPPKTSSLRQFTERAWEGARVAESELAYWQALLERNPALPRDGDGPNDFASQSEVSVALDPERTHAFLKSAHPLYQSTPLDFLILAWARACHEWLGKNSVGLLLEGHGRADLGDDIDVTRTVGWFTSLVPLVVEIDTDDIAGQLASVKRARQEQPGHGLGFGLLRFGDTPTGKRLRALPLPELGLNYLGQTGGTLSEDTLLRTARESRGPEQHPSAERPNVFNLDAIVLGGQLRLALLFSRNLHTPATVERLAERTLSALIAILDHVGAQSGAPVPRELSHGRLSRELLDKVVQRQKRKRR